MNINYLIRRLLLFAAILLASITHAQPPDWVNPPGWERAIEVQERYTEALMARDGIEGTGIGYDDNGEVAIKVYTARAGVPGIPQAIEHVPVQVIVTGRFVARADPTAWFPRPVPIGVSTGHPDITAGTIGARVTDGTYVYALSNNHVLANSNDANINDNMLQPGPFDNGQDPADAIGTLTDFEPIDFSGGDNHMDAAIAMSSTSELGFATPGGDGYGTPSPITVAAFPGQKVQKYGRTTGWTMGEVAEVNVTLDICYEVRGLLRCVKPARFVNQIAITPGTFSDGGDSGSLIVTDDANNNPLGLLFAGSSTRTIANRIDVVLNRFNVTIDDGSGDNTNSPPSADFTYSTSNLTASFTDQSSDSDGSITSWSWNFGDGNTSSEQNPPHTYAVGGTYTTSLTVTDNGGAHDTTYQDVTVSDSTANNPPTADFSYATSNLTAHFIDQSTDLDGSMVGWSWDFGDGNTSTAQNPGHTYHEGGTYTVSLTVTDDDSAQDTTSKNVTISEPVTGDITLNANGYKVRGLKKVDLEWSGASGDNVDVYRNASFLKSTPNDGFYTDNIDQRGGGSYTYKICNTGTNTCSADVTVTF